MRIRAIVFFLLDFRFEYSPVADPSGHPYLSYHWNCVGHKLLSISFCYFIFS